MIIRSLRYGLLSLAAGIAMFYSGCGSPAALRLTERDNGRTITLRKGQELIVTLTSPVPPWSLHVETSEGIVQQRTGWSEGPETAGAQRNTVFVFEGVARGEVTLTFLVRRPDRPDEQPRETFKVHVVVE